METPEKENYQRLESLADNRKAAVEVARSARRELALFSHDLEPMLYDTQEFMAAVQALVTRTRFAKVRVVSIDPGPSVRAGHRLIQLAQRFTSYIEMRRASKGHAQVAETFLIADETGLLYRPIASRYEGFAGVDTALDARLHLKAFEDIWNQADPDPEFRRLGI